MHLLNMAADLLPQLRVLKTSWYTRYNFGLQPSLAPKSLAGSNAILYCEFSRKGFGKQLGNLGLGHILPQCPHQLGQGGF